jgi:hypothetical protein
MSLTQAGRAGPQAQQGNGDRVVPRLAKVVNDRETAEGRQKKRKPKANNSKMDDALSGLIRPCDATSDVEKADEEASVKR